MQNFLPLTPIEHYMYAVDSIESPVVFWFRLTFEGEINLERLESALQLVAIRHPLLTAHIHGGDSKKATTALKWEIQSNSQDNFKIIRDFDTLKLSRNAAYIDITKEIGIRCFIEQNSEKCSSLLFEFHHCACDGMGAMKFLEDVLAAYHHPKPQETLFTPSDVNQLQNRGNFDYAKSILTKNSSMLETWKNVCHSFCSATPIVAQAPPPTLSDIPSCVSDELTQIQLNQLRASTKHLGGTINDCLLHTLFCSIDTWNRAHGKAGDIRISMPINMRNPSHVKIPASNISGEYSLNRRGFEIEQSQTLYTSIIQETSKVKTGCQGYKAFHALEQVKRIPYLIHFLGRYPSTKATAVLTNLGVLFQNTLLPQVHNEIEVDGCRLTRVEFIPPSSPGKSIVLGVATYANRMICTLSYYHAKIADSDAKALLKLFMTELRKHCLP